MKFLKIIFTLIAFVVFGAALSFNVRAELAPPQQPPQSNPHPPASPADQKRVEFAELAVRLFLMRGEVKSGNVPVKTTAYLNKDRSCLLEPACYGRDEAFVDQVNQLKNSYGLVTEFKHSHIIPWSWSQFQSSKSKAVIAQPPAAETTFRSMNAPVLAVPLKSDEYMVHLYVKFSKVPEWYHLDVILSEDAAVNPVLRYFYVAPMRASLPPGVVC